jgi:hypothetical protein
MCEPGALVEQSRWILSSSAQVFASLAALSGVFGVFRLQQIAAKRDALLAHLLHLCDSGQVDFLRIHIPDVYGDKPLLDSDAVADLVTNGIATSKALRDVRAKLEATGQSQTATTNLRRQATWVRDQIDVILTRATLLEESHRTVRSAVVQSLVIGSAMVALSLVALWASALATIAQTWAITCVCLALAMVALVWMTYRSSQIVR